MFRPPDATQNLQVLYQYHATKAVFENCIFTAPCVEREYYQPHSKTSQERRVTGPWRAVSVLICERITTVRKITAEGAQYQASSQDTFPHICEKECIFSSVQ